MKKALLAVAGFVAIGAWVGSAYSQHDHKHEHGHGHDHGHGHEHGKSAEHQHGEGEMGQFQAAGPQHKILAQMGGTWAVKQTMWAAPGSEPMVMPATEEVRVILNGLGVSGDYSSGPFSGHGVTVWNADKKMYQNYWVDNSAGSTPTTWFSTYDASTKTMTGMMETPHGKMKAVSKFTSKDSHTMMFFLVMPDGSEFKQMQFEYTRAG